jgi:general secretion pathway protein N
MRYRMLQAISGILAIGWLPPCAWAATAPVQRGLMDTGLTPFVNTAVKPRPSGERAPQTGNPLWAISLESLSFTRERPLFSPSRRPPAQAIVAPPPPPRAAPVVPEQLQLTLVGTVIGDNEHIGVFLDQATRKVVRLQVGQGAAGWILRDVEARTATFKKDQRQTMLALPSRDGRQESPPQIVTKQGTSPRPADRRGTPRRQPRPASASKAESSAPVASAHDGGETPASSGTWRDGDGQLISPPKSPVPIVNAADAPAAAKSATWIDGDGETIAPPASYQAANDGPPPTPQADTWRDGDGQMIQPPAAEPTRYGGGTWVDGDGRFVDPPSR